MELMVNGQIYHVDDEPDRPLLWVLRDELGLTGTKYGCGIGICGACEVHLDGVATRSCITMLSAVEGRAVRTIEGLSSGEIIHPVQQAFQAALRASCVLAMAYDALDEHQSLQVSLQPLREAVLTLGDKGAQMARWLPYDASSPPEALWQNSLVELADGLGRTDRQLESIGAENIEIVLNPAELGMEEGNDRADL